jgi:predicted MPP superfamily phosphohydrolase
MTQRIPNVATLQWFTGVISTLSTQNLLGTFTNRIRFRRYGVEMVEQHWSFLVLKWGLGQASTACVALLLVNRWLIHWVDGPYKLIVIGSTGLASIVFALWSAQSSWLISILLPVALLSVFALGEFHRAYLRSSYRPATRDNSPFDLKRVLRPVTTTDVITRRYTTFADLGVKNLRIAQLSDFHFNPTLPTSYFEDVFEKVRSESPDLIVITGDFISKAAYLPVLRRLMPLMPKTPLGVYSVLGNHDYWTQIHEQIRAELANANITLLGGRCETIPLRGTRRLLLCGTEKPWGPEAILTTKETDDYVIVLSHTPDNVYAWAERANVMFAGHNHGGQLRLPALGALIVPSLYGRRFDRGHFKVKGTELFVSAGIGVEAPPIRLFCRPEIVILDIVPQPNLS